MLLDVPMSTLTTARNGMRATLAEIDSLVKTAHRWQPERPRYGVERSRRSCMPPTTAIEVPDIDPERGLAR